MPLIPTVYICLTSKSTARAHQRSRSEQAGWPGVRSRSPRALTWRVSPATNIVCPGTVSPARPEAKALANLPPSAEPRAASHSWEHTACAHRRPRSRLPGAAALGPLPPSAGTDSHFLLSERSSVYASSGLPGWGAFKKKTKNIFIYLRMRERQRHGRREKQAPCGEPDVGPDPATPGPRPGPKAALNRRAARGPLRCFQCRFRGSGSRGRPLPSRPASAAPAPTRRAHGSRGEPGASQGRPRGPAARRPPRVHRAAPCVLPAASSGEEGAQRDDRGAGCEERERGDPEPEIRCPEGSQLPC
ncbi:translation initiation factor IF-2-like isoform X9 [Canis lupus familiaris]|uniref:translation initiation factor IF-2-like isoform X9 n=1 Tax=Canis lupus familiaris TaxID=9615 RepID=UPI0018F7142E|nr:translation initiation factor IF-2-like isoform X9 [Canis lupus familiaris]